MSNEQDELSLKPDVRVSDEGIKDGIRKMETAGQASAFTADKAECRNKGFGCLVWIGLVGVIITEMFFGLYKIQIATFCVIAGYWAIVKPWVAAKRATQEPSYSRHRVWMLFGEGLFTNACVTFLTLPIFISICALTLFFTFMIADVRTYKPYDMWACPVLDNLATKAELFRVENGTLPGLDRKPEYSLIAGVGTALVTSALAPNRKDLSGKETLQTFMLQGTNYVPAVAKWNGKGLVIRPVAPEDAVRHFASELRCNVAEDFLGGPLLPSHIFYRIDGYSEKLHVFALGAFGDDNGLASGTGFAILEICSPLFKIRSCWKYTCMNPLLEYGGPKRCRGGQMALLSAQEWPGVPGEKDNVCWIGDVSTNGLLSCDSKQVHRALEELKAAGWLDLEQALAETEQQDTVKGSQNER